MKIAPNGRFSPHVKPTTGFPGWRKLNWPDYLLATLVALLCVLVEQIWPLRVGLNLGDEGFLWYGVQRVLAGEIPVRDFQSYEPGRYYLFAAWAWLVHSDGIVALRTGVAVVQCAALFTALLLMLRVLPSRWLLPIFGILLSLWMAPRHKMLDVAAPIWMTYALAATIVRPDRRSHFLLGFFVAALWLIGINHVLYGLVSAALVIIAVACADRLEKRAWIERLGSAAVGALLAALLELFWLLAVPRFLTGYWTNAIARLWETGTTNLTLPVQWPWQITAPWDVWYGLSARATSLGFVLIPATVLLAAIVLMAKANRQQLRQYPIALAAAATTAAWAHHAFARADVWHLAQAGAPLAISLIALPETVTGMSRGLMRAACWSALAIVSIFSVAFLSPAIAARLPGAPAYEWCDVNGERLYVPDSTRQAYGVAADMVRQMSPGQTALFVPYDPGLYAVFRLRCPIYESYPLFPASRSEQQEVIANLERRHTDWILYWPDQMDGRPDLGFAQTDRMVWQYVSRTFALDKIAANAGGAQIYRRTAPDATR
jgi:hypothetical protein